MADRKAVIKNADMAEDMQQDAIDCATQALEKYNIEKDIAAFIKKEFDKKYNPTWHAIVGRNFGSYVTHETKHFIYFYLGQVAILLFKSAEAAGARAAAVVAVRGVSWPRRLFGWLGDMEFGCRGSGGRRGGSCLHARTHTRMCV
eukprot:CAMPEP_0204531724 /NCGR_PEP_ID=MMETSP0661-20131031/11325_1 /ASSEMBLY_ACC=CAM_ASM_000606 /TAXON_ID=109239 /ORGANISM="Alexandrium margalefi, Strain AMGDE01CS-322" /LENGTH=144 /DNA_ID=CAMNT_0051537897 /DNA_START=57 /DNA_END=489 /DNA_ORIENTATION=+